MELISITTGSWFPRTKLHLKEYYAFLKDGTSHLDLDEKELKSLHKRLSPRDVRYVGGDFDKVSADFDGIGGTYHEDGLLILHKPVLDIEEDLEKIRRFYDDGISRVLTFLYSIGTPVVSYHIPHIGQRPIVILAKGMTDDEAQIFCAEHDNEIHFIARHTDRTVYFATTLILINDETGGAGKTKYVIDYLILFREYEHKLRHYLDLHRGLWEDIARIQERTMIPASELPAIRDTLLDHKRDLAVIRARIAQMRTYLKERRSVIDGLGIEEEMRAVEAYRFGKLEGSTDYVGRLWDMLDEYLASTVELTEFIYRENLQKEIGIQQFIFLVAAVAGVLALGDMTGATIWFDYQGARVEGVLSAFRTKNLLVFGGSAIALSLLVYYGVRPLIKTLSRIRAEKLMGSFAGSRVRKAKEDVPAHPIDE